MGVTHTRPGHRTKIGNLMPFSLPYMYSLKRTNVIYYKSVDRTTPCERGRSRLLRSTTRHSPGALFIDSRRRSSFCRSLTLEVKLLDVP